MQHKFSIHTRGENKNEWREETRVEKNYFIGIGRANSTTIRLLCVT